jgi:hypothetical protein
MKMVMNRDITVSGLSGHAIRFQKNIPTHVPPEMMEDVMAKGAIPAEGQEMPEVEEVKPVTVPVGIRRKDILFQEFDKMVAENNRNDFNAHGVPKSTVVKTNVGFHVDSIEIRDLWNDYKERQAQED